MLISGYFIKEITKEMTRGMGKEMAKRRYVCVELLGSSKRTAHTVETRRSALSKEMVKEMTRDCVKETSKELVKQGNGF